MNTQILPTSDRFVYLVNGKEVEVSCLGYYRCREPLTFQELVRWASWLRVKRSLGKL